MIKMIEHRYYVCEHCGKRFEDEEECQAHERLEEMGQYLNRFTLYDSLYNPIDFKEIAENYDRYDDVFYVAIQDGVAGDALNEFIEEEIGYQFYKEAGRPISYPCVIGFWQDECWQNLTAMRNGLDEILTHVN